VSLVLALALAIPVCLAGITWSLMRWLDPVVGLAEEANVVAVLLHPHMDDEQRATWMANQRRDHPLWRLELVPQAELASRLTHWFPYLGDLLEGDGASMLPPLVEITADDPESVAALSRSPAVVAVGPTVPVRRVLGAAAAGLGLVLAAASAVLLLSAALLAAVWVHLELYRHSDEITVMRLVGATEAALQGPFLVATAAPGVVAGLLAILGTLAVTAALSKFAGALGLPPVKVSSVMLALQGVASCALPLAAAAITLARHAVVELEG